MPDPHRLGLHRSAAPMPDRGDDMPDSTTQPTPEPLISAEAVRAVIAAVVAAGWIVPIPDPILAIAIPALVSVAGLGVSWALTMISRGKVWALRRGVDVDRVVDEVQRRTAS